MLVGHLLLPFICSKLVLSINIFIQFLQISLGHAVNNKKGVLLEIYEQQADGLVYTDSVEGGKDVVGNKAALNTVQLKVNSIHVA